jgi:hypothetical protein
MRLAFGEGDQLFDRGSRLRYSPRKILGITISPTAEKSLITS